MAGPVLEEVENWINGNQRIQWAPAVNRGWERWAQLDFYLHLRNKGIEASVEDQCYQTGQFCDISTSPHTNAFGAVIPGAVLEFKVLNRVDSVAAYAKKLQDDYDKLQNDLNGNFSNHQKCSYGVAPVARLLVLLKEKHRDAAHQGDPVSEQEFSGWMNKNFPNHHFEITQSALGEYFVISFRSMD